MKTLITFMIALLLISCNDDKDCTQQAQLFKRVSAQNSRASQATVIISSDTVINGNVNAFAWRNNGAYNVKVNGYIKTDAFFYNRGATVVATNFIDIGSNLYFEDYGGSVTTHTFIDVNEHIVATQPATINYCESLDYGVIDAPVTTVQDCSLSIGETTGMMYLQDVAVPCDFNFTTQDDPIYYWVKID